MRNIEVYLSFVWGLEIPKNREPGKACLHELTISDLYLLINFLFYNYTNSYILVFYLNSHNLVENLNCL